MVKQIPGLDIMKYCMAILIIAMHSDLTESLSSYSSLQFVSTFLVRLEGCAVPTFFILSSFLFFKKYRESEEKWTVLKHFWSRLFILYGFWWCVFAVFFFQTRGYLKLAWYEMLYTIPKDFFFASSFPASWFFGALLIGVPILCLCERILTNKLLWIVPLAYLIILNTTFGEVYLIKDTYYEFFGTSINLSWPRGIIPLSFGYYLAGVKVISNISKAKVLPACSICLFCIITSAFNGISELFYEILIQITSIGFFVIAYNMNVSKIGTCLCKRLRAYSILYYCTHYSIIHSFWKLHFAEINHGGGGDFYRCLFYSHPCSYYNI